MQTQTFRAGYKSPCLSILQAIASIRRELQEVTSKDRTLHSEPQNPQAWMSGCSNLEGEERICTSSLSHHPAALPCQAPSPSLPPHQLPSPSSHLHFIRFPNQSCCPNHPALLPIPLVRGSTSADISISCHTAAGFRGLLLDQIPHCVCTAVHL